MSDVVQVQPGDTCQYDNCKELATDIASGYTSKKPQVYCQRHANVVRNEEGPDRVVCCPNCACMFGTWI